MDVFKVFPEAIVSQVWELGISEKGTIMGNKYTPIRYLDVIADEVVGARFNNSPNSDYSQSNTLLYVKPEQLPKAVGLGLLSGYMVRNSETGEHYNIEEVGTGKDQSTGKITHYELILSPVEVFNG